VDEEGRGGGAAGAAGAKLGGILEIGLITFVPL
jgi:hypothetical protein